MSDAEQKQSMEAKVLPQAILDASRRQIDWDARQAHLLAHVDEQKALINLYRAAHNTLVKLEVAPSEKDEFDRRIEQLEGLMMQSEEQIESLQREHEANATYLKFNAIIVAAMEKAAS
ncbi:Hypothetical protein POVN_LOCUS727 [uncultured virus]|nr:Hypothetical protein POVN_LOCUS727 [uncultured virus]